MQWFNDNRRRWNLIKIRWVGSLLLSSELKRAYTWPNLNLHNRKLWSRTLNSCYVVPHKNQKFDIDTTLTYISYKMRSSAFQFWIGQHSYVDVNVTGSSIWNNLLQIWQRTFPYIKCSASGYNSVWSTYFTNLV